MEQTVAVRLADETVAELEEIADALQRANDGEKFTQSHVLRRAIVRGIAQLRTDLGLKPARSPRK